MAMRAVALGFLVWCVSVLAAAAGEGEGLSGSSLGGEGCWPSYEAWSSGPMRVRLAKGVDGVVFAMYSSPGDLEGLRGLVEAMKREGLGNGFDPGPGPGARELLAYLADVGWPVISYPPYGGEFQVKQGRAALSDGDEATMQILDEAGLFCAVQLGEWGYFFHILSRDEGWFRRVYGEQYEQFKHLLMPKEHGGYARAMDSRRACYEAVRDYFMTRQRAMRGRNMSVTGLSHYEAYAAEWGARMVGLELGENIMFSQSKMAFARGAARQWSLPWSVQVSPWFGAAVTTNGPLRKEGDIAAGLDAGHSLSFYRRMWLHGWFAGAAWVTPENSIAIFFEAAKAPWKLTEHGRAAAEVFAFMRGHDRGVPYTPVAVVLDHLCGYNGYMDKPWGVLEKTAGDQEVYDLFNQQLYPQGADRERTAEGDNPESRYLRPTPYGEMFDVLLSSAPGEVLGAYPVVLLAGDVTFDDAFVIALHEALRRGARVLLHERHAAALGAELDRLRGTGQVEVLEGSVKAATGRPAAIAAEQMVRLRDELLPVTVEGQGPSGR